MLISHEPLRLVESDQVEVHCFASRIRNTWVSCHWDNLIVSYIYQGPVPEKSNNSIPGINVPE